MFGVCGRVRLGNAPGGSSISAVFRDGGLGERIVVLLLL